MADPKPFLTDEEAAALEKDSAPPQFIPDAAAAQPSLAGIATSAPPAQAPLPQIAPSAGRGEALARGGLQGATFGFSDELAAIPSALLGSDPLLGAKFDAPTFGGRYEQARDFYAARNRGAKAEYPGTYLLGQIGGGIATPGVSSVAAVGGLSNAARIAALAGAGATTGALTGAGSAEPGQRLSGAGTGALVGAVAAPLLDAGVRTVGALSGTIAEGARKAAGFALSRVAGGIQRDVSPAGGVGAFAEAGLEGYKRGLIRPLDFLPGAAERQADRVAPVLEGAGKEIETTLKGAGSVALNDVKDAIVDATSKLRQTPNLNAGKLAEVDRLFKDLDELSGGSSQLDASQLQVAKEAVNDLIKSWDPGRLVGRADKALERTRQRLYGALSGQQEDAVAASVAAAPAGWKSGTAAWAQSPQLAAYQAAKQTYGLAKTLTGFQESAQRRGANQLAGVGGLHGAGAGVYGIMQALSGDPVAGAATYLGTRIATSPRTHALAALGIAKAASALPAYAQSALNPLVARSAAQAIVASLNQ